VEREAITSVARRQTVRNVRPEPFATLGAEPVFLRAEREIHGGRRYPLSSPNPFSSQEPPRAAFASAAGSW